MIINFILPGTGVNPIGGFKVIYEYANRLFEKGFNINLIHSHRSRKSYNPLKILYRKYEYYNIKSNKKYFPDSWFKINDGIKVLFIPYIDNKYIPSADVIFATEWTTAKPVLKLSSEKGKKFYFIQSLETWLGPEEEVIETWKYPMSKIVISMWLKEYAEKIGEKSTYIPDGLDFEKFGIDIHPSSRKPLSLLMLYHRNNVKGTIYGMNALVRIKEEIKDIKVYMFSSFPKGPDIPEWINYYYRPDGKTLRDMYNNSAIFISPSLHEGFSLTPAEAMACGCAVVATDNGGHREFCIDYKTALMVNIKSSTEIYLKIKELIQNDNLRIQIAKNGNKYIQRFSWDKSIEKLMKVIGN